MCSSMNFVILGTVTFGIFCHFLKKLIIAYPNLFFCQVTVFGHNFDTNRIAQQFCCGCTRSSRPNKWI